LEFERDGLPGKARFEFLILPDNFSSIQGGLAPGLVEVGKDIVISTHQPPAGETFTYTWQVFPENSSTPLPMGGTPGYIIVGQQFDGAITTFRFNTPGVYVVKVIVAGQNQTPAEYVTVVQVVAPGTIPDPANGGPEPLFGDLQSPQVGLSAAELQEKPGRAVLHELPNPGFKPQEIRVREKRSGGCIGNMWKRRCEKV
jgi:hypothetical protein